MEGGEGAARRLRATAGTFGIERDGASSVDDGGCVGCCAWACEAFGARLGAWMVGGVVWRGEEGRASFASGGGCCGIERDETSLGGQRQVRWGVVCWSTGRFEHAGGRIEGGDGERREVGEGKAARRLRAAAGSLGVVRRSRWVEEQRGASAWGG